MIKLRLLTLLCLALIVVSCQKENPSPNVSVDDQVVREVTSLATVTARKLAFQSLNPGEKLALLKSQMDYILENAKLNSDQIALITEMKSNFKQDMYSEDKQVKAAYAGTVKIYETKLLAAFAKDFIRDYFTVILNQNSTEVMEAAGIGCSCSTDSDWCWTGETCDPLNVCAPSADGCGTFWRHRCNGKCSTTQDEG